MKVESQIAGIKFAVNANPSLALARPDGPVTFVRCRDFDVDKKTKEMGPSCLAGIKVMWDDSHIGWIPKGSEQMSAMNALIDRDAPMPEGRVLSYAYSTGKDNFNQDHAGILAAVTIEIDLPGDDEIGKNFEFYEKGGKQYNRASTILKKFNPEDNQFLLKWMIEKFASFVEYTSYMTDSAAKGTDAHDAIEKACEAGAMGCAGKDVEKIVKAIPQGDFDRIPAGFWNFVQAETEGMDAIDMEQTVYDDDIMVAGTYDFFGKQDHKAVLIDWKSSKAVTFDHVLKTCFYAYHKKADEAWVVCFGSPNKCKYQLKKVDKAVIAVGYEIVTLIAKASRAVDRMKTLMKG